MLCCVVKGYSFIFLQFTCTRKEYASAYVVRRKKQKTAKDSTATDSTPTESDFNYNPCASNFSYLRMENLHSIVSRVALGPTIYLLQASLNLFHITIVIVSQLKTCNYANKV